jgi:hypothetical protein
LTSKDLTLVCQPRGIGDTRWTARNPPNFIARSHVLLGRTVDSGRVWDVAATAKFLIADAQERKLPVVVAGQGSAGLLAAYAALLTPEIEGAIVVDPPATHMEAAAPPLLNILRVCDVPQMLGMLAPRSLQIAGATSDLSQRVHQIYSAAGAEKSLSAAGQ